MNRKGQALVEFILILPVFLLILFAIVDFGNVLYNRNHLENISTDIILMIKNGKTTEEITKEYEDLKIEKNTEEEDYYKIILEKKIDIITPFLDKVLGDPCIITVERIIPKDE